MSDRKVIYDERIPKLKEQRKRKTNQRFALLIIVFFVLVMIFLYFQSSYSELANVHWQGHELLRESQLMEEAQLEQGMGFFNFTTGQVQERLEEMDEIDEVHVSRLFPNELQVEINEHDIVAFWFEGQKLFPVLENGMIIEEHPWENQPVHHPILADWSHQEGVDVLSAELAELPASIRTLISEIYLTPTDSDTDRLTLFMNDGYEVRTSIRDFADNMKWYPEYVQQAQGDGLDEAIFYLLDGKWLEVP